MLFSHQNSDRLRDLVAEHLDHMHYLNDILSLDNNLLNESLIKHLLHRLFLPLYVRSLADGVPGDDSVRFCRLPRSLSHQFHLNCAKNKNKILFIPVVLRRSL